MQFWNELSEDGRKQLATQVQGLDLQQIEDLNSAKRSMSYSGIELASNAQPPPAIRLDGGENQVSAEMARRRGEDALRAGEVGVILVAGGQGTRLGFDHPKGMFPLGPVSGRTLFQILFERLQAVARRYSSHIPLYLMTSPATHDETIQFLDDQSNLGLADDDLRVFCQGTMPAVDSNGRIFLASKDSLALSPDGHGGMLAAMWRSGNLENAIERGIKYLYYCQVDNPLAQIGDPGLIGFHILNRSEMTTQAVAKTEPEERVGNVVSIDGSVRIIEYINFPKEVAAQRNDEGKLKYWAGNIAIHVFDVEFLQRMASLDDALPFHRATKKVTHVDQSGQLVAPNEPNATKFERFIFDLLPHAKNAITVEGKRELVFAPVKNANNANVDSPATAQALMVGQFRQWLHSAGVHVDDGVMVEVSPLFALDADELANKVVTGTTVTEDTFFV